MLDRQPCVKELVRLQGTTSFVKRVVFDINKDGSGKCVPVPQEEAFYNGLTFTSISFKEHKPIPKPRDMTGQEILELYLKKPFMARTRGCTIWCTINAIDSRPNQIGTIQVDEVWKNHTNLEYTTDGVTINEFTIKG